MGKFRSLRRSRSQANFGRAPRVERPARDNYSVMRTEDKAAKNRQLWVVEWAKSEAFWRDVASRATAGFIVVLLVGFGAWVASDRIRPSLSSAGAGIGILLVAICVGWLWNRIWWPILLRRKTVIAQLLIVAIGGGGYLGLFLATINIANAASEWAFVSTGGTL